MCLCRDFILFFHVSNCRITNCGHEHGWAMLPHMRVWEGVRGGGLDPPQNPKYPSQTRCHGKILTKKFIYDDQNHIHVFSYLMHVFLGWSGPP